MLCTRSNFLALAACLLIVLLGGVPAAFAQSEGLAQLSGRVTDSSGAVLRDASVHIQDQDTGIVRTVRTNAEGIYAAPGLQPGNYRVTVEAAGFDTLVTENVVLRVAQSSALDFPLKVGSVKSSIVVSADSQRVNTETSEISGTVDSKQISNLMLNGRNFQTLAVAIPGVISSSYANSLPGGGRTAGNTLVVNGSSQQYTTYTIDGVYDVNSGSLQSLNIYPDVDGIEEFRVLQSNYSAKYGIAGSGHVIIETKHGTDTFHGSAWDYLRNNAFDATNFFSTSKLELHQNIFGYTFGGPVAIPRLYEPAAKKTFFFASNQWYRTISGNTERGAVFTQAMRNGDLSASPTLNGSLTLDAHSQALLAAEGKTNCIAGPKALNAACLDPVAVGIMNAYVPLPNDTAAGFDNYINEAPTRTNLNDYQYRVDHYVTAANQLMGRFNYQQWHSAFPYDNWSGIPYSTLPNNQTGTYLNMMLRFQSALSPRLMNSVSIAETFDKPRFTNPDNGSLPAGLTILQEFPNAPALNRIPNIAISGGWTGNGVSSSPITASDGEGMAMDDLSWQKGNHLLQAGAFYMFGIKRQNVGTNPQGSFTFSGVHTGDPAADYLLGLDATYTQASAQPEGYVHYRQGEAYFQDDWKATSRLTLNLGVRWFYFSNDTVSGDHVTSFDPAHYDAAAAPVVNVTGSLAVNSQNEPLNSAGEPANLINGLVFAGQNGVPSGFFIPRKTNFGPRVGFAYDVFGDGTTAIRGGYGIGYGRLAISPIFNAFGQNPPYNESAEILNSLISNGTAGTTAAPTPQTLDTVPFSFRPEQIHSFSLTVERQVVPNLVATVGYAGGLGRHLTGYEDINFPLSVTAPSTTGCLGTQAAVQQYDFDPCINTGKASANYTRPYKGYGSITNQQYDDGSSNYNGLLSGLRYQTRNGSQVSIAYTLSKSLATLSGAGAAAQNPRNFHAEYGPVSFDYRNALSATWVYSIPALRGGDVLARSVLNDWSFIGLFLHQSGAALTPGLSTSTSGEATRPNQIAPYRKVGTVKEWFDTSAYAAPNYGFFGDAHNGGIQGPAYTSFNVALSRQFPIAERLRGQFRAEAFNVLNHPNFSSVTTAVGSGSYGQVTAARDPRIVEFAMKFIF